MCPSSSAGSLGSWFCWQSKRDHEFLQKLRKKQNQSSWQSFWVAFSHMCTSMDSLWAPHSGAALQPKIPATAGLLSKPQAWLALESFPCPPMQQC